VSQDEIVQSGRGSTVDETAYLPIRAANAQFEDAKLHLMSCFNIWLSNID
jgi:hypothetical protein